MLERGKLGVGFPSKPIAISVTKENELEMRVFVDVASIHSVSMIIWVYVGTAYANIKQQIAVASTSRDEKA